jgi:ABC-type glycerol-3-phosphate transport system permease component
MYSAAIAKAVIGDKTPSNELVENFKSAKERYRKRTIPVAIGTFGVISIASIIMQNFLYIIFGILAGYIIQRLDLKYHYLKEETKWFGIK